LKSHTTFQDEFNHYQQFLFSDLTSQIKEINVRENKKQFQKIQNLLKIERFNK